MKNVAKTSPALSIGDLTQWIELNNPCTELFELASTALEVLEEAGADNAEFIITMFDDGEYMVEFDVLENSIDDSRVLEVAKAHSAEAKVTHYVKAIGGHVQDMVAVKLSMMSIPTDVKNNEEIKTVNPEVNEKSIDEDIQQAHQETSQASHSDDNITKTEVRDEESKTFWANDMVRYAGYGILTVAAFGIGLLVYNKLRK